MICVLLATYNGEKYIAQQLDSLLKQTYKQFHIFIHDDGSNDNTVSILNDYAKRFSHKITIIDAAPTGNACANFALLLNSTHGQYYMFCDQDDVWEENKIEKTYLCMCEAEKGNENMPILVHTNLSVVSADLKVIDNSFFNFQAIDAERDKLQNLLVQNIVTGCTVMINSALKEIAGDIPITAAMHDWWLALVAAAMGKIVCIDTPIVKYRQHSSNQVGAKRAKGIGFVRSKIATISKVRENYNATFVQAKALLEQFENVLPQESKELLKIYCQIPKMSKFKRINTAKKYGFLKNTYLRRWGQYIFM